MGELLFERYATPSNNIFYFRVSVSKGYDVSKDLSLVT